MNKPIQSSSPDHLPFEREVIMKEGDWVVMQYSTTNDLYYILNVSSGIITWGSSKWLVSFFHIRLWYICFTLYSNDALFTIDKMVKA